MDGLQPWAKTELKRRRVQNLADALAEAESLVDYSNHKESTSKPKDQNEGQGKVWRDRSPRKETHRDNTPRRHQESSSWKGKAKDAQGLRKPSSSKCFICDGDHWARQCPQRQALSSLLARYQEENDVDGCQEGAHIGSLQLLNGIQSTPKIETKGLLFADVAINGKATRAMVDTGASHNFISPEEATRLGVKVTGGKGSIKAVNSATKPIHGIAQKVKTDIGTWSDHLNFSIVPMDDYKLILGIEFLDQVKAIPMPFVNAISITEGNQACVVPMIRGTTQESKVLSALQLEEEDTNRGSLETSMLAFPTCYKGKSRAQHRGAKRRRHQADKMQRPPKFKEGSTHRGRKSKIRRSISTIPRRPRDEGIAGLGGGGCHDPPSCPRLNQGKTRTMGHFKDKNAPKMDLERFNMVHTSLGAVQDDRERTMSIQNRGARCQGPRVPGRFRSKRGIAWDQGFQRVPEVSSTVQARPAPGRGFQTDPGCARRTLGVPEGSRRDRHPGGVSRQTRGASEGPWGFQKIIAIVGLQRGIPSKRESSARVDYVPALCTHRLSLLPIEWSGEVFGSRRRGRFAARDVARKRPVNVLSNINGRGCGRFIAPRPLPVPVTREPVSPWQNEQPPA
ncbi:hypothetical protein V6N13_008433 [Hibiscus sabdariffa]